MAAPPPPVKPKKTVVFCLPGRTFSNRFLTCWSNSLSALIKSENYNVLLSNEYSSFVAFARAKCLGADVLRGPDQKPFDGKVNYDVIVWIDSDMVWTSNQLVELIETAASVHPVVSGIYKMEDQVHFATVPAWDDDYYAQHGSYMFLTQELIDRFRNETGSHVMTCAYTGMGFMALRKGVLENMKYPWFCRNLHEIQSTNSTRPSIVEGCSEDVAFCRGVKEQAGIDILVNLNLRVGHEKAVVL